MITFNDWLLTDSDISKDILAQVELDANTQGVSLSEALENSPLVSEELYLKNVAKYYDTKFMTADVILKEMDKSLLEMVTPEMVKEYNFIPFRLDGPSLQIIVSSVYSVRNAEMIASSRISCEYVIPIYATKNDVEALIDKFYTKAIISDDSVVDIDESMYGNYNRYDLNNSANDSYVNRIIADMICTAIDNAVSDIHIAPEKDEVSIRFRKDGVLSEYSIFKNKALLRRMVAKIKTMSQLKMEETREAQSGHFSIEHNGSEVNFRVSVLPTIHGIEKITLRILNQNALGLTIDNMYFNDTIKKDFLKTIRKPQGIILITGPTGSGKTTTLYTALKTIACPEVNVVTLEDPVEYQLGEYIVQSQYNPEIGMDFAAILKEVLRQDPDVILIGEIRDRETAKIAIEASNTGHLVFSTLHTNNAVGAITRLSEMGIDSFNLSDSLLAVMAQRLVRRVCPKCGIPHDYILSQDDKELLGTDEDIVSGMRINEVGCPVCGYSGYKGRIPIHEFLVVDDAVRLMLSEGSTGKEFRNYIDNTLKVPKMNVDAFGKLKNGLTTMDEIHRVLG